ncbi:MAG TPA: hypothetical protein VN808_01965 [Stellaceae bacterium]|nr:hypothetical protein [Stellaceae bacterium]
MRSPESSRREEALNRISYAKDHHLNWLYLYNLQLTSIPEEIYELTWIRMLGSDFNNIKHIPNDILNLKNLRTLDISFNGIEIIPKTIFSLYSLTTLKMSYSSITEISDDIDI